MTITEPRVTTATTPTIEELDEELADLQTIIEWQNDQLRHLRYIVGALVQGHLTPDFRAFALDALYPCREDGVPAGASFYRYQRPARRWAKFNREALLELAEAHGVTLPGIRRCSRDIIERTLREDGVLGNVKIVRR